MQKNVIITVTSLLFLSVLIFFTTAQATQDDQTPQGISNNNLDNLGANFESICTDKECNITFYSYDKYFKRNGNWEEIDESWHSCPEGFCTNDYFIKAIASPNGQVTLRNDTIEFTQQVSAFGTDEILLSQPIIEGSVLIYKNILPNIDLRYQYLPHKLKEEIIINQPIENISHNLLATFSLTGNSNFKMDKPFICDSNKKCRVISYSINSSYASLNIPIDFLSRSDLSYPLIIDPSFNFGTPSIAWNGRIEDLGGTYQRLDNPSSLELGDLGGTTAYGAIDWSLEQIPDLGSISNVYLALYIETFTAPNYLEITELSDNSTTYPDDNDGNAKLYDIIAAGYPYSYAYSPIPLANFTIYFPFDEYGINNVIFASNYSWWLGIGLKTNLSQNITISARDHPNPAQRPFLLVNYDITTSSANDAIEEGIYNVIPGEPILDNRQIYVVGLNGQQSLGRFEKTTFRNNQTWAFNYYTYGENPINVSLLFNIVNIWQNTFLNYTEIVEEVQTFVNSTLIP